MPKLDLDDFVGSVREVSQPSVQHADQLFERVMAKVGVVPLDNDISKGTELNGLSDPSTATALGSQTAGTLGGVKAMLGVGALVSLSTGLAFLTPASTDETPQSTVENTVTVVEEERDEIAPEVPARVPEPLVEEVAPEKKSPSTVGKAKRSAPRDTLAVEVAIVRKAKLALNEKRYKEALGLLDKYQRNFPQGTLRAEAQATRVLVLCALNKSGQARDAAQRLDGDSALGKRMKEGCKDH